MKAVIICCLMALLCHKAEAQIKKSDLQGAWKLVAALENINGITGNFIGKYATMSETKIWSGNQVMFVNQYKGRKEQSEDYGSGTWKFNGKDYEEFYTISSFDERFENKTVRFKLEMKGDTLVQTYSLNGKSETALDTLYIWKYLKIK